MKPLPFINEPVVPIIPEFLTDPIIRDISEGYDTQKLQFMDDFVWRSAVLGCVVIVPAGFIFEESIPAFLLGLVRQYGFSKRAAGGHDWGYQKAYYQPAAYDIDAKKWIPSGDVIQVNRKKADEVYLELAVLKGMPQWRIIIRHGILRLAGWRAWNKHRRKS